MTVSTTSILQTQVGPHFYALNVWPSSLKLILDAILIAVPPRSDYIFITGRPTLPVDHYLGMQRCSSVDANDITSSLLAISHPPSLPPTHTGGTGGGQGARSCGISDVTVDSANFDATAYCDGIIEHVRKHSS
jgi:hypothetical protein